MLTAHWAGFGKKMKIVVCNTEWASGQKQEKLNDIVFSFDPDIVCATEVKKDFFLKEGNIIFSESDYGYKTVNKYKVSLWSKTPWLKYEKKLQNAPSGRFISAFTEYNGILINITGVCIPWKSAHVSTGNKNRKIWEDHVSYLDALKVYLEKQNSECQIICGDMNQRIPMVKQPEFVYSKLMQTLRKFNVISRGVISGINDVVIDHIAVKGFSAYELHGVSRIHNGIELTDHDLIFCNLNQNY